MKDSFVVKMQKIINCKKKYLQKKQNFDIIFLVVTVLKSEREEKNVSYW